MSWKVKRQKVKTVTKRRPAETGSLAAAVVFAIAQLAADLSQTQRFWITLAVGCVAAGITSWKVRSE